VRIILDNLIDNAIKFNLNNPNLQITVGQYSQHGEPCIYVKDNGIGFETKDSKKAFDPFERLGDTSRTPGYGLGLSIVQRAVKRLGGQTWAESKLGEGATFYFILPKYKHV
jgi:signal transduction histidine kinase